MNFKATITNKAANPADQTVAVNLSMVPDGSSPASRPHSVTLFIPVSEEKDWPLLGIKTVAIS